MVYWSNGGNFSINTCTLWKSNFFSSKLAYMHHLQVESLFQWNDVFSSVCQGSNAFSVLHKKMVTLIAGAASIVYSKVDMNLIKNGQKWLTWTPGQAVYLLTIRSSFTPLLHKVLLYRKQGLASKHGATSTAWKTKRFQCDGQKWKQFEGRGGLLCQNANNTWRKSQQNAAPSLPDLSLKLDLLVLTFTELRGSVWQVSRRIKWTHTGSLAQTRTQPLSVLPKGLLSF